MHTVLAIETQLCIPTWLRQDMARGWVVSLKIWSCYKCSIRHARAPTRTAQSAETPAVKAFHVRIVEPCATGSLGTLSAMLQAAAGAMFSKT